MSEPGTALQSLAERYWQFLRFEFPLNALLAGQPCEDPAMFRASPADADRRARQASALLNELQGLPVDSLEGQEITTHRLLERELCDLRDAHAAASHLRPWLLPAGPEFNTVYFANVSQVHDLPSAQVYVERLQHLGGYFDDVLDCLRLGRAQGLRLPRVVLQGALANLEALLQAATQDVAQSPWLGPFKRSPVAGQPAMQQAAEASRQAVTDRLLPALNRLALAMREELLPAARESIACTDDPGGEAFYAHWVRHFTTTGLSAEQVHRLGLREVQRLEEEISEVAGQAGHAGDVSGYRRFLQEDPGFFAPTADALRESVESLAKRVDGLIPSLLGHLPRASYGVQVIPPAAATKLPIAYAQPSPADASAAGVLWVSGLQERVPLYALPSLVLHEAWPGHLMHIALMQEMDGLPMFRRANFTQYTACLEGWAMYCEWLGEEIGLYSTPHQRFGRLDMEMWRACRLVVDTGIHVGGWTRQQAVDFMADRLSMPLQAIEAEVDRYIAMPAQALGYMIGGLKFRELRQRAESALAERFDRRRYHDHLMATGAVTLPVLEASVERWLRAHAA